MSDREDGVEVERCGFGGATNPKDAGEGDGDCLSILFGEDSHAIAFDNAFYEIGSYPECDGKWIGLGFWLEEPSVGLR